MNKSFNSGFFNDKNLKRVLYTAVIFIIFVELINLTIDFNSISVDNLLSVIQIFVSIILISTTVIMAFSSNKIAKESIKNGNYSLIEIYKIIQDNNELPWGCHVLESINNKGKQESCRFVFFVKGLRQGNTVITKFKINKIEIYDFFEVNKIYSFIYKWGEGNDSNGFIDSEQQIFHDKTCIDNEGYRLPIIFYHKDINVFKNTLKKDFKIKMDIEIVNHMNIKTKCRISFQSKLISEGEIYVGQVGYSYFNNIEIE